MARLPLTAYRLSSLLPLLRVSLPRPSAPECAAELAGLGRSCPGVSVARRNCGLARPADHVNSASPTRTAARAGGRTPTHSPHRPTLAAGCARAPRASGALSSSAAKQRQRLFLALERGNKGIEPAERENWRTTATVHAWVDSSSDGSSFVSAAFAFACPGRFRSV